MKHSHLKVREGRRSYETEIEGGGRLLDALANLDSARLDTPLRRQRTLRQVQAPAGLGRTLRAGRGGVPHPLRGRASARDPLACLARAAGDAEDRAPRARRRAIVVAGPDSGVVPDPLVRLVAVAPRAPRLEDQADDEVRLLDAVSRELALQGASDLAPRRVAFRALPVSRSIAAAPTAERRPSARSWPTGRSSASLPSPGRESPGRRRGLGDDDCRRLPRRSRHRGAPRLPLGAQRPASFGADVISRIEAARSREGLAALSGRVGSQIAAMAAALAGRRGGGRGGPRSPSPSRATRPCSTSSPASPRKRSPARLSSPPSSGAGRERRRAGPRRPSGLRRHPPAGGIGLRGGRYRRGDAVVGLQDAEGRSLFLDLGTNGEIVFGGRDGIVCCATAAGPAFEGAGIEKGTGGVAGAIDSVWIEDGSNPLRHDRRRACDGNLRVGARRRAGRFPRLRDRRRYREGGRRDEGGRCLRPSKAGGGRASRARRLPGPRARNLRSQADVRAAAPRKGGDRGRHRHAPQVVRRLSREVSTSTWRGASAASSTSAGAPHIGSSPALSRTA